MDIGLKYADNTGMQHPDIQDPFLRKLRQVIDNDPTLSDAGLASSAGLDNSTIRTMFKNAHKRSPRLDTARKICAALGTTLEEFMSEAQTPEEQQIVRLVMQLPVHLRQQLLSYGQGLADAADQAPPKPPEADK